MKKWLLIIIALGLFIPSFIIGYFVGDFQASDIIDETDRKEHMGLGESSENYTDDNALQDDFNNNDYNAISGDSDDSDLSELIDENTLNSIERAMEDPKAVETLASVVGQLDNVQLVLEDDGEKEMIKLIQKTLNEYMSEGDPNTETVSQALTLYKQLSSQQRDRVIKAITSNIGWAELLYLKKIFDI